MGCYSATTANPCSEQLSATLVKECRNMLALQYKTHLMSWSPDKEDAKILLDIHFPMNHVIS